MSLQAPSANPPKAQGERQRRVRWHRHRARDVSAVAAAGAGRGVILIGRLVATVTGLVVLLIVLAIVLRDAGANPHNTIVKGVHKGAHFFAGPFDGLFTFRGHPKKELSIDWGVGALIYLIAGAIIAGWLQSAGITSLFAGRRAARV
ncbi:MAG TPA: hypothetical protein VHX88_02415 [Solirubrobacteraceae bacterium]|nr:hypothetical protein [Solirubrobacteraceae bacterium]